MEEKSIEERLLELEGYERKFFDLGQYMFEPKRVHLYHLDLLATAVMDRSLSVIFGFTSQIRTNNYTCAAPLVRLHLDNLLRFHAAYISEDCHQFSKRVLDGEHIRNLQDKKGKKMRDSYLVAELSKEYPWIKGVYEETSGYVHLSNKAMFNSSQIKESGKIAFSVSRYDRWLTDKSKIEAIDCMKEITEILYKYLHGWTVTKRLAGFEKQVLVDNQ
jgi:hypothetical protein